MDLAKCLTFSIAASVMESRGLASPVGVIGVGGEATVDIYELLFGGGPLKTAAQRPRFPPIISPTAEGVKPPSPQPSRREREESRRLLDVLGGRGEKRIDSVPRLRDRIGACNERDALRVHLEVLEPRHGLHFPGLPEALALGVQQRARKDTDPQPRVVYFEHRSRGEPNGPLGFLHVSHAITNSNSRATIPRAFLILNPNIWYFYLTLPVHGFNLDFNKVTSATFTNE